MCKLDVILPDVQKGSSVFIPGSDSTSKTDGVQKTLAEHNKNKQTTIYKGESLVSYPN